MSGSDFDVILLSVFSLVLIEQNHMMDLCAYFSSQFKALIAMNIDFHFRSRKKLKGF